MVEPYETKLPRINFGDGHAAVLAQEGTTRKDRNGVLLQRLLIIPTERLQMTFEIKKEDLNVITPMGYNAIWKEYPKSLVDWVKRDPIDPVLFIWCDFNGSRTVPMDKNITLLELDEMRQKEIEARKYREAYLIEQYRNAMAINVQLVKDFEELRSKIEGVREEAPEGEM